MFPAPWSQEMNLKYRTTVNQERGLETFGRTSLVAQDGKESACSAGDLGSIPGSEVPLEKGTAATQSGILLRVKSPPFPRAPPILVPPLPRPQI